MRSTVVQFPSLSRAQHRAIVAARAVRDALPSPRIGADGVGFLTQTSGSTIVDGGLGALAGYLAAPGAKFDGKTAAYSAAGAAAGALFGVAGIVGVLGFGAARKWLFGSGRRR